MKKALQTNLFFCLLWVFSGQVLGQNTSYTDVSLFENAAAPCFVQIENFDGFGNGQQVSQLFGGQITFDSPLPTVFFGGFGSGGFSGGAAIPEPRFQSHPLNINFSSPVFGIGGNVFDDFDGSPFVATITLTVTTTSNSTFSVSETSPNVGDCGFLGATSTEGIVSASFSISGSGGNLEVDFLRLISASPTITSIQTFDNSGTAGDNVGCHNGNLFFGVNLDLSNPAEQPFSFQWTASPVANATFLGATDQNFAGATLSNTSAAQIPVTFSVLITNVFGCQTTGELLVNANPQITIDNIQRIENSGTPNDGGICFGDEITFDAQISPVGDYSFSWDNGLTTNPITVVPPATNANTLYYLTVTDAFGCTDNELISAKGITEIIATADPIVDCVNGDEIILTMTGGVPAPGGYLVFDPPGNPIGQFQDSPWHRAVFTSGTYDFFVKDEKGCSATASANIVLPIDTDEDGLRDDCDDCPLAVENLPNFDEINCHCEPGFFPNLLEINGEMVIVGCTPCPAGSFCPDGENQILCPAGSFQGNSGSTFCQSCPAGSFQGNIGSTVCESCPAGSFSDVEGSTVCQSCPAGSFQGNSGSTVCESCPAGKFSDVEGSVICQNCPAGSFQGNTGSTECESCPPGHFSSSTGSTICESCPAGSFQGNTGSTVCESCPAGSFSNVEGSVICQNCPAGSFQGNIGSTVCESCPAGSFSNLTGSTVCTSCPAGTFSNISGSTVCPNCPNGTNSPPGSTTCTPDSGGECETNILTNPGFENGSSGWVFSGVDIVSNHVHSGQKAAKINGNNGNGKQNKPASAGQNWSASVWAKNNSGNSNPKIVALRFLNGSGGVLATFSQNVPPNTNDFTQFSMSGTAPAGTASAQVYFSKNQGGGVLYVDDWCLEMQNLLLISSSKSLTFNARRKNFEVELNWLNNSGDLNDYFVVERAADGTNFSPILKKDGTGAAGEMLYFNELDKNPLPGESFYRLKWVLKNGSSSFSEIQKVEMPAPADFSLFPNPTTGDVWLKLPENPKSGFSKVTIVNVLGVSIREISLPQNVSEPVRLVLDGLPAGLYDVQISGENVRGKPQKLVIAQR